MSDRQVVIAGTTSLMAGLALYSAIKAVAGAFVSVVTYAFVAVQ